MKEMDDKDDQISKLTQELTQIQQVMAEKETKYKSMMSDGKKAMTELSEMNRFASHALFAPLSVARFCALKKRVSKFTSKWHFFALLKASRQVVFWVVQCLMLVQLSKSARL